MDKNKEVEWSITLTVRLERRGEHSREELLDLAELLMFEYKYSELLISVERYTKYKGHHIHIYYRGEPIYWKTFNPKWKLGYVKNRKIFNLDGWLRYVKKQGNYRQHGNRKLSIIERFVGPIEQYLQPSTTNDDDKVVYDEDDLFNFIN